MFGKTLSAFVSGLALVSAYTTPTTQLNGQDAIFKPGLAENVPAGSVYTITWSPDTTGPVDLVLVAGPSTNVQPVLTIVAGTANTGSYAWTVPTTLAQSLGQGYGIQLIDDATGEYQYSDQFGISNPSNPGGSSSSNSTASSGSTATASAASNSTMVMSTSSSAATSTVYSNSSSSTAAPTTTMGTQVANSPTPTATQGSSTGAAARLAISLGGAAVALVAAVAAF